MNATISTADSTPVAADTVSPSPVTLSLTDAAISPDDIPAVQAALARDGKTPNPLDLWKKFLVPADADFARRYQELEARVKSPVGASGLAGVSQFVIKALVEALEQAGKVSKFEVAFVARDPKQPIVYYYTRDGRVIGHAPGLDGQNFLPNVFGFSFNFFKGLGFFDLKQTLVLVLPNGDCILINAS